MNEKSLLSCLRLPGRLNVEQAGQILGFLPHELSVLVRAGLLRPLGRPSANGHKFFCTAELLELSQTREWLDKATRAVTKRWQERNHPTSPNLRHPNGIEAGVTSHSRAT